MHFLVEMSGIEPESERFGPRTSTSVVDLFYRRLTSRPTEKFNWLTTGTRKSLFRTFSGVYRAAPRLFDAHSILRSGIGAGGRGPAFEDQLLTRSLMQRGALQRSCLCGWHLIFCAGLTRSAPLGSQFGVSLSRRDLSSPCGYIIHD